MSSTITSDLGLISSMNMNTYGQWNNPNDSYYPRLMPKSNNDEVVFEKFQYDTLVKLETGQTKNIQQLTTNDFLISMKQSQQYSR